MIESMGELSVQACVHAGLIDCRTEMACNSSICMNGDTLSLHTVIGQQKAVSSPVPPSGQREKQLQMTLSHSPREEADKVYILDLFVQFTEQMVKMMMAIIIYSGYFSNPDKSLKKALFSNTISCIFCVDSEMQYLAVAPKRIWTLEIV